MLNPLGAILLEMDPGPGVRCDNRFLRARIGICARELLPSKHWMLYRDASGYVSSFEVHFEIESDKPGGQGGRGGGSDGRGLGPDKGTRALGNKPSGKPVVGKPKVPGRTNNGTKDVSMNDLVPPKGVQIKEPEVKSNGDAGDKPAVPGKGKQVVTSQSCGNGLNAAKSEDTDSSDDGGLRAHFQHYYGSGERVLAPSSQSTAQGSSPLPTQTQPMDSDEATLVQRMTRLQRMRAATASPRAHKTHPPTSPPTSGFKTTSVAKKRGLSAPPPIGSAQQRGRCVTRRVTTPTGTSNRPAENREAYYTPAPRAHTASPQQTARTGRHVGPTGPRRGLRSLSPHWPSSRRPQSPTGASPKKPIVLSDSSSDQQLPTPTITYETSSRTMAVGRKSLRIQVQGGPVSILARAQKRARERGEGSTSNSGNPLVNIFPFRRLSLEQIVDLFNVYHIQLGIPGQDSRPIISAIQHMSRDNFEDYIKTLLSKANDMSKVVVDSSDFDSHNFADHTVSK